MAFAATPGHVAGGLPRVNLMPRAEIERRARNALMRRWGAGLVAAVAIVAVATAGAFWLQSSAEQRLADANDRTKELLTQVAALAPVRAKLSLLDELQTFRETAMGADLNWTTLDAIIAGVLPDGVAVSGFTIAPGVPAQGEDPTLEAGAVGTLNLTSPTAVDIVPLIRNLRGAEGILAADGREVRTDGEGFSYLLQVDFDQTIYTGDYLGEAAE